MEYYTSHFPGLRKRKVDSNNNNNNNVEHLTQIYTDSAPYDKHPNNFLYLFTLLKSFIYSTIYSISQRIYTHLKLRVLLFYDNLKTILYKFGIIRMDDFKSDKVMLTENIQKRVTLKRLVIVGFIILFCYTY